MCYMCVDGCRFVKLHRRLFSRKIPGATLSKEGALSNRKPWLEKLRTRMIVRPIQTDARTLQDNPHRRPLGKDVNWIFNHAIGGGQANFDAPIADLTSQDRVMLYAYLNQKAHVDELIHAFNQLLTNSKFPNNATIIDIGCGPFTAGLALANVVGDSVPYRYFGVDHSVSMCKLGSILADAVTTERQFHPKTEIVFHQHIDGINFGEVKGSEIIIFVLSYLLASDSVDIEELAQQIKTARDKVGFGAAVLLYTNTGRERARIRYPDFRKSLTAVGFIEQTEKVEVFKESDKDRLLHYALFISPAISTVDTKGFFG